MLNQQIAAIVDAKKAGATNLETTIEYINALKASTELLSLWQSLETAGTIYSGYFGQTNKPVVIRQVSYGDSYAQKQGWTNYVNSDDKRAYIRSLYK